VGDIGKMGRTIPGILARGLCEGSIYHIRVGGKTMDIIERSGSKDELISSFGCSNFFMKNCFFPYNPSDDTTPI